MTCLALPAIAQDTLTGDEIVAQMNARDDGNYVTRGFSIELTDRSGKTRTEKTIAYRRYFGDEKRTIIFYTEPTRVRGTGFLTYDYADPAIDDDQWLYLPALRKVRRISASDRGDYFLGTDFTYEEISNPVFTQEHGVTGSVMDYNATNLLDGGNNYFQTKPGPYDYWAIKYGYSSKPFNSNLSDEEWTETITTISPNRYTFTIIITGNIIS